MAKQPKKSTIGWKYEADVCDSGCAEPCNFNDDQSNLQMLDMLDRLGKTPAAGAAR